jgi:2-polyprenyl-3-methyl-5-hydroxy-6-metoxy-1,4-benzoquinol methylase
VCEYIAKQIKPRKVFDLGCGVGAYGKVIKFLDPEVKMIGADGYLQYLASAFTIECYDVVIRARIENVVGGDVVVPADLVLFMDVLEHFEKPDGEKVLDFLKTYPKAIISTPMYDYPQGAVDGNELERHRTFWTEAELVEHGWTMLTKDNWEGRGDIGAFIHG